MSYAPNTQPIETDIAELLLADHRHAEALLHRFDETANAKRGEYFAGLVPILVGHEVAEEEIVYPALRSVDPRVSSILDARIAEQAEAEELLKSMEEMDAESALFATSFAELRAAVLEHVEREERTVLPLLDEFADTLDRATMGTRYRKAKAVAPTHPHPHAPDTPPGNFVVERVAAVADRVRDSLKS